MQQMGHQSTVPQQCLLLGWTQVLPPLLRAIERCFVEDSYCLEIRPPLLYEEGLVNKGRNPFETLESRNA